MLVRLDPNSSTINVLSVPRDLQGQIPGGRRVEDRRSSTPPTRSAARTCWSRSLKTQVFPGLQVNHIVDINFGGFEDLVNAIGCVYTDVDHRYYNNTGAHRLLEHRHPARLPEAVRRNAERWRSCASATPTPTSSATPASRTSSAGPRTSSALDAAARQPRQAAEDLRVHTADRPRPAHDRRPDQPVQPGRVLRRPHDQADPVPGDPPAVRRRPARRRAQTPCYVTANAGAEQHAFRPVHDATRLASPAGAAERATEAWPQARRHHRRTPDLFADDADGKTQAAALGSIGMPVYYPKMLAIGSEYCSAAIGNCPTVRRSPRPARTPART